MKILRLLPALLLPSILFATAGDIDFKRKNSTDTGWGDFVLPIGNNVLFGTNGSGTPVTVTVDGSLSFASGVLALPNVGVTAQSYGDSSHVVVVTVDLKGRITTATSTAISASAIGALLATNNLSDVANAATSATNLGLGAASVVSHLALNIGGTAGSGYITLPSQSVAPSAPASGNIRIYSDASNKFAWIGASGFTRSFDGTLTASRSFVLPDTSGTFVLDSATQTLTNKSIDASQLTGTVAVGRLPAFTGGDATTSAGSGVITLATVNASPNSYGDGTHSLAATVNAKGLVTSMSSQIVTPSYLNVTSLPTNTFLGNNTGSTANAIALTATQVKTALSLNLVENTALTTWAGSANITTLGNVTFGTWNAGAITSSGAIAGTSLKASGLTSGRVPYITTAGLLTDAAAFNYNSSTGALSATSFVGPLTGNASTATALATPRAINGVNFDGSAPITVTAAAGTLTGTTLNSTVVTSSLTQVGTLTSLTLRPATDVSVLTLNQANSGSAGWTAYASNAGSLALTRIGGNTAVTFDLNGNATFLTTGTQTFGSGAFNGAISGVSTLGMSSAITQTAVSNVAVDATSSGASCLIKVKGSSGDQWQFGEGMAIAGDWGVTNATRSITPILITGGTTTPLITLGGSVGIGQTPGFKLDVYDSTLTSTTLYANVVQRISSHATNADCTIQFSDAINNNTYLSSNLGAWNFATNSKVTQFSISAAGNGAFTGTATATQLISTTTALDVTATLAASVNSVAVFRNQSSTTGTGQDLQFINNGSAAGATNCLGIIRYVQTGANAASSMTIYHNGGSSVNAWISVSSAEAITFPNLTLSAGIKTQAHYFPLTIGATTINVLTD